MSNENSGLVSDALYKSNPTLAASLDYSNAFKADILKQGARVALYRDYERGDHRAVVTDQMKMLLRISKDESGFNDFNGNYCAVVLDKMAGRLFVSEVTTKDPETDDAWLAPLLEENDWDNIQTTTFRGAIRDADSYIMVDPQTLAWTAEPAYDGFSGIVAVFETGSRTPVWACKVWSEAGESDSTDVMRLVVYQPGSVSYWRGQSGGAEVQADDGFITFEGDDLQPGEFTTTNAAKFPIKKVPIVHFANKYENYSETGESEIRAAIPLQDVYNRTLHTLTYASENAGYTKPYCKGMEINVDGMVPGATINLVLTDASGNIINEPSDAQLAFLSAVEVGQIEATDTGQFLATLDKIERVISQVTQTPIYGITTAENLSGEALKQLEIGLIGKVIRFQQQNTDAVRELITLTAEMQNAFRIDGKGSAPEIEQVAVTWKSPEILDVTSQIAALVQMRTSAPGLWSDDWYRAKIGGLLGMSQNDITKQAEEVKTMKRTMLKDKINTARVPVGADNMPMVEKQ